MSSWGEWAMDWVCKLGSWVFEKASVAFGPLCFVAACAFCCYVFYVVLRDILAHNLVLNYNPAAWRHNDRIDAERAENRRVAIQQMDQSDRQRQWGEQQFNQQQRHYQQMNQRAEQQRAEQQRHYQWMNQRRYWINKILLYFYLPVMLSVSPGTYVVVSGLLISVFLSKGNPWPWCLRSEQVWLLAYYSLTCYLSQPRCFRSSRYADSPLWCVQIYGQWYVHSNLTTGFLLTIDLFMWFPLCV